MADIADQADAAVLATQELSGPVAEIRAGLAQPGYTDCLDCGEPIPPARRAAMPSARRCAFCQDQAEKGR